MIPKKTLPMKLKVLWFAVSTISSVWFLYWICYDIFVWNKLLIQVRTQNYIGLTLFIALTILGTQLEKTGISEKLMPLIERIRKEPQPRNIEKLHQIQQEPQEKQLQSIEHLQQIKPVKDMKTEISDRGTKIPPGCKFYLGYLQKRPRSLEIPEKCLECEYVVNCLSPARTIEESVVKV